MAVKLSVASILFVMTSVLVLTYLGVLTPIFDNALGMCFFAIDWQYFASMGLFFCIVPLAIEVITHILILIKMKKFGIQGRKCITKAIRTATLTVGAYYMCCGPFFTYVVWMLLTPAKSPPPQNVAGFAVMYMAVFNSVINLVIYAHSLKDFRDQLKTCLCKSSMAPIS